MSVHEFATHVTYVKSAVSCCMRGLKRLLCWQAAHMFLCRTVLWDFDGLWKWLIAARDAPVVAIASYAQNRQLQKVIAIRRQGIFYNHICLPENEHALAQPMRNTTQHLMGVVKSPDAQIGTVTQTL